MLALISAGETAQRLKISEGDVDKLVASEILRPAKETDGNRLFYESDIERIASNRDPKLSEEAAQMGIQIQQEVVSSVSSLQRRNRHFLVGAGSAVILLAILVGILAAMFKLYPSRTSDFFGYYYRFNAGKSSIFSPGAGFDLLGTDVAPADLNQNTSLAASLVKPVAAASLLVVKATDTHRYEQIVRPPAAVTAAPGSAGKPGQPGIDGLDGKTGLNGTNGADGADGAEGAAGANGSSGVDGAAGVDGTNGMNGTNGVDGVDGVDGTDGASVYDVMTAAGDIAIRDSTDTTVRLGAGSDGQVLTIDGGIPAWMDTAGLTAESDTLASVTARGSTTSSDLTFNGGLTFSGSVNLSGLTDCQILATDSSGDLACGTYPASTGTVAAAFTDTDPATDAENNTTELFNNLSKPHITPASAGQSVLVSVHIRFTAVGNKDIYAAARVVRNAGSPASCSGSTQVGDLFSAFLTNKTDTISASGTFLDTPATTATVYYTVCSSSSSDLGDTPVTNRVDVALIGVGQ